MIFSSPIIDDATPPNDLLVVRPGIVKRVGEGEGGGGGVVVVLVAAAAAAAAAAAWWWWWWRRRRQQWKFCEWCSLLSARFLVLGAWCLVWCSLLSALVLTHDAADGERSEYDTHKAHVGERRGASLSRALSLSLSLSQLDSAAVSSYSRTLAAS